MIDEEETFRRFGYRSTDLKPQSNKKIVAICDDCGKVRDITKQQCRTLCLSCGHKGEHNPFFGKHHSKKTRRKICKARKGKKHSKEALEKMSGKNNHRYGKHHSEEHRKKIGDANRGKHHSEEAKHRISEGHKNPSKETRKKISIARQHQHFPTHHTKPELIFESICQRNNIDFHYVGDGSLWIGKKGEKKINPDFIEANGKKICVEIMGAYWHSPLLNKNIPARALQPYREKHYRKYKWQPIFIWDTDLLREDAERFVLATLKREAGE